VVVEGRGGGHRPGRRHLDGVGGLVGIALCAAAGGRAALAGAGGSLGSGAAAVLGLGRERLARGERLG
jgi:hypothetical protein